MNYVRIVAGALMCTASVAAYAQPTDAFTWDERLPGGQTVRGSAEFGPDGDVHEVYTLDGAPASEEALRARGWQSKRWNTPPLSVPAALPSQPARLAPAPPAPLALSLPKSTTTTIDATPLAGALTAFHADVEADAEKGTYRIGLFADLVTSISIHGEQLSAGHWQPLPDGGYLARFDIQSVGAAALRVEFAQLLLPAGGYAIVYDVSAGQVFGPFTEIPAGDATLWSPSTSGDTARIEVVLPGGAPVAAAHVEVRRVVHQVVDPALFTKAAGACNLDVTCYPTWAQTALGVGGLGVITNVGSLFCTGTLLNDNDPCSDTPYVLTANHCVGNQSEASSLEFYWEYQTATCGGAAPSPSSVPRTTGGADYLSGSGGTGQSGGGNDHTLLRMRNDPPSNLTRVGYSSAVQSLGTPVTCIHHPRGHYKRITFGTLTNPTGNFPNFYHEVTWSQGTTEPGSSGSVLMLSATQQIIGQLWGGLASCSNPSASDFYGRFDRTFPAIEQYIGGPPRVAFALQTFEASEDEGTVAITLTLPSPAPAGGATVDYSFTPGTAQPGYDYTAVSGTASFLTGETETSFVIALVNNTHFENEEALTIALSNPSPCISLAPGEESVELTIMDDDTDTDGDGISDSDELSGFYGVPTNPLLADSDGDGVNDRREQSGTGAVAPTNPNNPDSDGDGMTDGMEIFYGTDPNVPGVYSLSSITVPWFK